MKLTAANILTLLRLVLVPFFVAAFAVEMKGYAFVIFCVAGFTDLIDGSVARFLNQPSEGGALLDPIADKLLMQSCFLSLLFAGFLPLWFFLLALARDVMIVSGISYLKLKKIALDYRPTWVSKFATLIQLAVAVLGLLCWWMPGLDLHRWQTASIVAAAALIVASGAKYVSMGFETLGKGKRSGS